MKLLQNVDQEFLTHLRFLNEFLAIPTVSSHPEAADDMQRACQWLQDRCDEAGLTTLVRQTPNGHPAVVAYTEPREHVPHIFFYGHYDVEASKQGFETIRRGDVLWGCGAGRQKGLLMAHLCALRSLHLLGGYLPINLTLLLEGEREIGSPHLSDHLEFLAKERAPFDLAFVATGTALEPDPSEDPKLPPEPYSSRLSESEKVLLEAAGAVLPGPDHIGSVVEPFHSLLGVQSLVLSLDDSGHSPDQISLESFNNWIRLVITTYHRLAERFQAYRSRKVASRH